MMLILHSHRDKMSFKPVQVWKWIDLVLNGGTNENNC